MSTSISYIAINKVNRILIELQKEYPEVYHLLDEEPTGLSTDNLKEINDEVLVNYAKDIKVILQQLDKTHIKKRNKK